MRARALAALLLFAPASAGAAEPAFEEGEVLGLADVAKLEPFVPPEFWAHRELFFYDGMRLEIGPTQRDYSPAAAYLAATERFVRVLARADGAAVPADSGQSPVPSKGREVTRPTGVAVSPFPPGTSRTKGTATGTDRESSPCTRVDSTSRLV